ncbi:MAG: HD domain-containing protein [Acidobacteria bacterium]|nr:HD domain-containing protein [Acidobacteriota bacterium]
MTRGVNNLRQAVHEFFHSFLPKRIPILYLVLSVLVLLSVVPLLFYSRVVATQNRQELETNERLLQNTITRSVAEEIRLYRNNLLTQVESLVRLLEASAGIEDVGNPVREKGLREATENFIRSTENVLYVAIVNPQLRGIQAGSPTPQEDLFFRRIMDRAAEAAHQGMQFHGGAMVVQRGQEKIPVMLLAIPLVHQRQEKGMIAALVRLNPIQVRLKQSSQWLADAKRWSLVTYVVDRAGRLVLGPDEENYPVGQDMTDVPIVQDFLSGSTLTTVTTTFQLERNNRRTEMLGTFAPVVELDWGVIAQKPTADAFRVAIQMERSALGLALVTILLSVLIGYISAQRITTPIQHLAQSTRAIAKGDFSRRVTLTSRTEIGELAQTFNLMTDDLERYVERLKQAAQENHELFLGSIRTLGAAIDEKDPYTRGHSGRVAKYSVILAEAMGLPEEEVYKIRISAMLHDVGKIGIDDRILKKPTGLTAEEFEVMKQHTIKGANIIRPVAQLREMLPGIEYHHESRDGNGYPYGLKSEEIPLMARVIAVADTLDAMTTNRPYQAAMELEMALEKIKALVGKKFDPDVVAALEKAVSTGRLKLTPQMVEV